MSVRTVYRDIRDLQASGVPIDGAAGVGYLLRPGYHLPPLMFLPSEIEALIVGARMVEAWAGRALAAAATEALVKIGAVVPAGADARGRAGADLRDGLPRPGGRAAQPRRLRQGDRRAARRCASPIATPMAAIPNGRSGRWRCTSGARSGRSPPGASCATISGRSASTGRSGSRIADDRYPAGRRPDARRLSRPDDAARRESFSRRPSSGSAPFIDFSLAKTASASTSASRSAFGADG